MNSLIVKWVTGVLSGLLVAFILYGAAMFYFCKPVPIVNNTTVQPGATQQVVQTKPAAASGHLMTGLYGGYKSVGVTVGYLW